MAQKRLDELVVLRGLAESREKAQALILGGFVWSKQQRMEKAGQKVDELLPLELRGAEPGFASRAGSKLSFALETFHIQPANKVVLDLGASTGGFTDCVLKAGAKHVFAVDVGYGQLDMKLRNHPQVTNLEKVNARYLTRAQLPGEVSFRERIDLAVADLSFISIRKVIEPVFGEFPEIKEWVLLFKPQFEVGKKEIGKGGVVKSEAATQKALEEFLDWAKKFPWELKGGPAASPLAGKKSGNLEYLLYYAQLS